MMTPIMRPILGLPGVVVLSLITTLQAIDAGAAMTKGLEETKQMTHIEVLRSTAFQITSGGCLTNFFSSGAVLFTLVAADGRSIPLTMGFTFLVILACKFINSFIMRLITLTAFKNH
jgi:nucleoside recognition membrane protein YjiH